MKVKRALYAPNAVWLAVAFLAGLGTLQIAGIVRSLCNSAPKPAALQLPQGSERIDNSQMFAVYGVRAQDPQERALGNLLMGKAAEIVTIALQQPADQRLASLREFDTLLMRYQQYKGQMPPDLPEQEHALAVSFKHRR